MKKFLPKSILTRTLLLGLVFLFYGSIQSFGQIDIRNDYCGTDYYSCTSENFTVHRIYLINANTGEELAISNQTCIVGYDVDTVSLGIEFTSNQNGDIYQARLFADLFIDGNEYQSDGNGGIEPAPDASGFVNIFLGTVPGKDNNYDGTGITIGTTTYGVLTLEDVLTFEWHCGEEVSISDFFTAWAVNNGKDYSVNYDCSSFNKSQCEFNSEIYIEAPLSVGFDSEPCQVGSETNVQFISQVYNGTAPYTYSWIFKENGIEVETSTVENPTFVFDGTEPYTAELIVTDATSITNNPALVQTITPPDELSIQSIDGDVISCDNNNDTITVNAAGGTGALKYSLDDGTPQDENYFVVTSSGTYTVAVTDENNCTTSSSIIIGDEVCCTLDIDCPSQLNYTVSCPSEIPPAATDEAGLLALGFNIVDYCGTLHVQPTTDDIPNCEGVVNRIYTITDDNNNTLQCTLVYTIDYSGGLTNLPADDGTTVSCPADAVDPGTPGTIKDACSRDVVPVLVGRTPAEGPDCEGSVVWTYRYTTCDGATYDWKYTYTIDYSGGLTNLPADDGTTVSCPADAVDPGTPGTIKDACSRDVVPVLVGRTPAEGPDCEGSVVWTYRYTTCDGTTYDWEYTYTIDYSGGLTNLPADDGTTVSCPADALVQPAAPATIQDACDRDVAPVLVGHDPAPDCNGDVVWTWSYTACDLTTVEYYTHTYHIVKDNPIVTCPGDQSRKIADAATHYTTDGTEFDLVSVTIDCGTPADTVVVVNQIEYDLETLAGFDLPVGKDTITWKVTDNCGNTGECTFYVTITRSRIPYYPCTLPPLVMECGENYDSIIQAWVDTALVVIEREAEDDDPITADMITHDYNGVLPPVECDANTALGKTVTFTITDDYGNSTTCSKKIIILDLTPPTIDTEASDLVVECNGEGNNGEFAQWLADHGDAVASDICSEVSWSYVINDTTNICGGADSVSVTFTAEDDCGNKSTSDAAFVIKDRTPPLFTAPRNITIYTDANCNFDASISLTGDVTDEADNCSNGLEATFVDQDTIPLENCEGGYTITRIWSLLDDCGNKAQDQTQLITIVDNIPPTFTVPADTIIHTDICLDMDVSPEIFGNVTNVADNCTEVPTIDWKDIEMDCFGSASSVNIDAGTGKYISFEVDGFDDLKAHDIEKLRLSFETNKGKGRAEFTLISPSGQGIMLVGSYCDDTEFCNTDSVQVFSPIFYPDSLGNEIWENSKDLPTGEANYTPYGATGATPGYTVNGLTAGVVDKFEDLTGPMNGTWTIYGRKQVLTNGKLKFIDVCLTPAWEKCGNNDIISRLWTVTDNCGNETSALQVIQLIDTTPPGFVENIPAEITVDCDAVPEMQDLTAIDSCGEIFDVIKTQDTISYGDCPSEMTILRTWTAADACENTSSVSQLINVQDTTPPMLDAAPADTIVDCNAVPVMAEITASDLCDESIEVTTAEIRVDGECENSYTLYRTWYAEDDCGNIDSVMQTITVQDTTPPMLDAAPADTIVDCNAVPVMAEITASDLCDESIEVTTAEIRIDGECDNSYTLYRTWYAEDLCGNIDSVMQTITVQDTTPPMLDAAPADTIVDCNAVPVMAEITASDLCDESIEVTTAEIRVDGECDNSYTLYRTWYAEDDCGNIDSVMQTITVQDTTPPMLDAAPADTIVDCNAVPVMAEITASDLCDESIEVTTAEIRIDGECDNSYTLYRTWYAEDDCGNIDSVMQTITVQDTTPPMLDAAPADTIVDCNAVPVMAEITASDLCDESIEVTTAEIRVDGECENSYTLYRTWYAEDLCGNIDSVMQTITVQDTTPPMLDAAPADTIVDCNAVPVMAEITASDLCDESIEVTTAEIRIDGECDNSYTLYRTWYAEDDCGNIDSVMQTITVQDTTPPMLDAAPADTIVDCNAVPVMAEITASDLCDESIEVTTAEIRVDGECENSYTLYRTWYAEDLCGNIDSVMQTITVQDTTPPMLDAAPADTIVDCNAVPVMAEITASDLCDESIEVTTAEIRVDGECENSYTLYRTWYAEDLCGNIDSVMQTITVQDTTPPMLDAAPADTIVDCNAVPVMAEITASDLCDESIEVTTAEIRVDGECDNSYTLYRTWYAEDLCGNIDSVMQTITVQDTTPPSLIANAIIPEGDLGIDACLAEMPEGPSEDAIAALYTDNCGTVTVIKATNSGENSDCNWSVTYNYTIEDECGNFADEVNITYSGGDNTAPVLTGTLPQGETGINACTSDMPEGPTEETIAALYTDACGDVTVTKTGGIGEEDTDCSWSVTYTYTIEDECGNFANEVNITYSGGDATPPTIVCPEDVTVNVDANDPDAIVNIPLPTVFDACGDVTYYNNFTNTEDASAIYPIGDTEVTYYATDDCGNIDSCKFTVSVLCEGQTRVDGVVYVGDLSGGQHNVMVTLIPQGNTPGETQMSITNTKGQYAFVNMVPGEYLVQVQDANLNAKGLFNVNSSLFFTTVVDCEFQTHNFEYEEFDGPAIGDLVWYDVNQNGVQDEWFDANNDGVVTQNFPDFSNNGYVDFSLWEWIDMNGDGSYEGPENEGELNKAGVGNSLNANIIITGLNNFRDSVIVGILGYYRSRPESMGEYTVALDFDVNLSAAAAVRGRSGLVKELPVMTKSAGIPLGINAKHAEYDSQCGVTSDNPQLAVLVEGAAIDLTKDFGVACTPATIEVFDMTVECDGNGNLEDFETFIAQFSVEGLPYEITVDSDTTEGCGLTRTVETTGIVTGSEFGNDTVSAVFRIEDTTPPTFTAPADITVYSGENCQVDTSTVATGDASSESDICSATELNATYTDLVEQGSCAGELIITRKWTLADACENQAEPQVQIITVLDTVAPVISCNDITVQLNANGVATITVDDINGGSTDNCGIDTIFIDRENFYCGGLGANEVTLTAIDECGNVSTCTATVTVEEGDYDCGVQPFRANADILTLIYCPGGTVSGDIDLFANDEGFSRENVSFNILTDLPEGVSVTDGELLYVNEDANEAVITFTYQVCHTVNTDNCDTAEVTIHILLDTDCDGVPDIDDIDDDDDGILDIIEEENALNQETLDSDGDGIVDRLDIDSDNDGIPDNIEWQSTIAEGGEYDYILPLGTDTNGDGWDDAYDPEDNGITYEPWDMDIDGTPDYLDLDTDDDGIEDAIEGYDANSDGIADVSPLGQDSDNDGLDDAYDTYDTSEEWLHGQNAIGSDASLQDTDDDGLRDWRDNTDDSEGPENFACGQPVIPNAFSPNQDGYNDYFKVMVYCTGDQGGNEERVLGDDFPEARIEIFNRWGNLIYEKERYGNIDYWGEYDAWWDGTSMHDMQIGKDQLPTGTYFYILYFNADDGRDPITGFIFLNN